MHLVKRLALLAAGTLATAGIGLAACPADAATHHQKAGSRSLAQVLAADGTKLDHNWQDFDILEAAVLTVVAAKPSSPVALLTDGSVRLTAFLPTDEAFRDLVGDLTGKRPGTEKKTVEGAAEDRRRRHHRGSAALPRRSRRHPRLAEGHRGREEGHQAHDRPGRKGQGRQPEGQHHPGRQGPRLRRPDRHPQRDRHQPRATSRSATPSTGCCCRSTSEAPSPRATVGPPRGGPTFCVAAGSASGDGTVLIGCGPSAPRAELGLQHWAASSGWRRASRWPDHRTRRGAEAVERQLLGTKMARYFQLPSLLTTDGEPVTRPPENATLRRLPSADDP